MAAASLHGVVIAEQHNVKPCWGCCLLRRSHGCCLSTSCTHSSTACRCSVAYQGVPGAYSEMAALKACPGWEPLPCEQFETAFQALSQVRVAESVCRL